MRASRPPVRVIAFKRVRLERTRANSAPTKNALRSTSRIWRELIEHGCHKQFGRDTSIATITTIHADDIARRRCVGTGVTPDPDSHRGPLVIEVIGGVLSNSIALLADAGHMLTDVAAVGLALFVAWFSRQPGTPGKTFGYLRWEILAAFINGSTLLLISAWILWEAVARFRVPQQVEGGLMLAVATAGMVVNIVAARILAGSSSHSLNTRGAYLHVLGDLLATAGTIVAAILIRYTGWLTADPIASILTTVLIMSGAWRLVRESDIPSNRRPPTSRCGGSRQLEAIPESSRCTICTSGR